MFDYEKIGKRIYEQRKFILKVSQDKMALQRLKEAAEKAKIELSSQNQAEINLPYITVVDGMPRHLVKSLSRAQFERLSDRLIQATLEPCKKEHSYEPTVLLFYSA